MFDMSTYNGATIAVDRDTTGNMFFYHDHLTYCKVYGEPVTWESKGFVFYDWVDHMSDLAVRVRMSS
jgi:hypothetical protein